MQLLQNCIGPTIRISQESWCLSYAGFFKDIIDLTQFYSSKIGSKVTGM